MKWLWSEDQLKISVIELSPIALKILSTSENIRLLSARPNKCMQVNIHDFNSITSIIKRTIIDLNGDIIDPKARTNKGTPGGPLLNEDFKVVGIHSDYWDMKETCKAININSILEAYTKYLKTNLRGKTENEIWLDKLKEVPKDEFLHIGGFV